MAHFKILATSADYPDVLLHRDRDEAGLEEVKIKACGIIDETENMFAEESIKFDDEQTALRFISDFSVRSAERWCDKEGIKYWKLDPDL